MFIQYKFSESGMESTQLALSWDDFQTNLQEAWRQLHRSEDFADVILACDVGQVLFVYYLDCLI